MLHEVSQFILELLCCVRLVNVRRDSMLQAAGQIQVQHRGVGQVELLSQFLRLLVQLFHVAGHVTNDDGIEDCAQRAQ